MVHLYFNIRSRLGGYFKDLGSIHGKLYKDWCWEVQHFYCSYQLVEIQLQTETLFRIAFGVLGYSVDFTVYNKNHHDSWR